MGSVLHVTTHALGAVRLGPAERGAAIATMAGTELQVLVVGGGVVGAGAALAADRAAPDQAGLVPVPIQSLRLGAGLRRRRRQRLRRARGGSRPGQGAAAAPS